MNQNTPIDERENVSEENVTKKNRRNNIIAFIICACLAFALWLMIRNNDADTSGIPELPPVSDQATESAK